MTALADLIVRPAAQEDHQRLLRIARTSPFTRDFGSIMFSSPAAYRKGWIQVAEQGPGIVGFTCVRHKVRQPKTVLYFIAVEPAVRGHRVGERLMRALEEHTPHRVIHLNVAHKNTEARRFYERLGYRVVRDDAISGTAWEMEKELT